MYLLLKTYLVLLLVLFSCKNERKDHKINDLTVTTVAKRPITKTGTTIKTRFDPPNNYKRIDAPENSFASYLQSFPLKPHNSKVYLFNGELKNNQNIHCAVLNIDIGKRDLQQCADAIMRLRAEFLFEQKQYQKIHFNFTNGFKANYSKWRSGFKIKVVGNQVNWTKTTDTQTTYKSFRNYLTVVFSYAGTLSLEKELLPTEIKNLKIGDVFIQGGSPGHAIIVVDMAINNIGEKMFLLAQSYMPAQDIHVLKNLNNKKISPWYSATNLQSLSTPEWRFTNDDLKRFH